MCSVIKIKPYCKYFRFIILDIDTHVRIIYAVDASFQYTKLPYYINA